jgi:hypothetical protein
MEFSGQCLCSSVSYVCSSEPVFAGNCHCDDCKKSTGSGYAPVMFFAEESVCMKGEVKYFSKLGSSGQSISRGFCPDCGSPMFSKVEVLPGIIGIRAGTLDDRSLYTPAMDIYTCQAEVWDAMDPKLPKFEEMPPQK